MGDFNFIITPDDRNRPGGDINDMLLFNEAINNLGLVELPLKGRQFTWSNMQERPLLIKLDWFFTSASWSNSYPATLVLPMAKPISDHLPCIVTMSPRFPSLKFSGLKITG